MIDYNFPLNPVDGQTYDFNGRTYTFIEQWDVWTREGCTVNDDPVDLYIVMVGTTTKVISKKEDYANDMKWMYTRELRDKKIAEVDWRYTRYARQTRLGIPTTDSIEALDAYTQALADITLQEDPSNVVWPTLN
jgi:Phage tail assembly chaperone protein